MSHIALPSPDIAILQRRNDIIRQLKKLGEDGFVWTPENIDKWISNPKAMLPDSPMAQLFQGVPDAQERANIVAYLKTQ